MANRQPFTSTRGLAEAAVPVLLLPAAQTAVAPGLVDTDARLSEVPTSGMGTVVQAEPFQFSVTAPPTAHTLLAEVAVMLARHAGLTWRGCLLNRADPARPVMLRMPGLSS